ncbi:lactate utilization protein [Desulfohalobiaceae bacterium Ax17]|uniref:lactate utilization protein n=1 Tax=Desulfovulcanus ferrireducens TaxID=2831190 RepID=UPI00207BBADF|nr:lactate utilization protein [Desulfovulcanus ferrireducens]MBT8764189.1 lactate utilization protein [Desulfovulcanus ferrireducens]
MKKFLENYWTIKLNEVKENLEANNFEVFLVNNVEEAREVVLQKIWPAITPVSVSWGGSRTFKQTGLYDELKKMDLKVIDTYVPGLSKDEAMELRRKSLFVDLYVTGTNAITENGALVNLDMIGNRVGAITFGPKFVLVLAGRNKIVPDFEAAVTRIKEYAAPANAMRLDKKTPCTKTSSCHNCESPDRICNVWTITEKSFPKGRIKIVLINEDLGI